MTYQLYNSNGNLEGVILLQNNKRICIPICADNTDYQTFKTAVLDQQPGGAVVEDGDSFSLNTNTDESILKDAEGNSMTIEQGKTYVRTLP